MSTRTFSPIDPRMYLAMLGGGPIAVGAAILSTLAAPWPAARSAILMLGLALAVIYVARSLRIRAVIDRGLITVYNPMSTRSMSLTDITVVSRQVIGFQWLRLEAEHQKPLFVAATLTDRSWRFLGPAGRIFTKEQDRLVNFLTQCAASATDSDMDKWC
jgi:hypothetical protein